MPKFPSVEWGRPISRTIENYDTFDNSATGTIENYNLCSIINGGNFTNVGQSQTMLVVW